MFSSRLAISRIDTNPIYGDHENSPFHAICSIVDFRQLNILLIKERRMLEFIPEVFQVIDQFAVVLFDMDRP